MTNRITLQNAGLRVSVDRQTDSCQLLLQNLHSGQTFGPVPLMALEIYDRTLLRVDRVTDFTV
jgi:hypothetical protein